MTRPKGSRNVHWDSVVAALRRHPDRWQLLPEMAAVPDRTIQVIRRRERRELRLDDGIIRCRRKATAWTEDGRVVCTLILKFETKGDKPNV